MQNKIRRVVAAVICQNNQFLLAQRSKHDSKYEKWEFSGGKVEGNETDHECLQRELSEKLGIIPTIGDHICEHNDQKMEMIAYFVMGY